MQEYLREEHGFGSFERGIHGDGILLYKVEGDLGESSPLPWELCRAVVRDVAQLQPCYIVFDLTEVDCFFGAPIGFFGNHASRCAKQVGRYISYWAAATLPVFGVFWRSFGFWTAR